MKEKVDKARKKPDLFGPGYLHAGRLWRRWQQQL